MDNPSYIYSPEPEEEIRDKVIRSSLACHGVKPEEVRVTTTSLEEEMGAVFTELQPYIPLGMAFAAMRNAIEAIHAVCYGQTITEVHAASLIKHLADEIHRRAEEFDKLPLHLRELPR